MATGGYSKDLSKSVNAPSGHGTVNTKVKNPLNKNEANQPAGFKPDAQSKGTEPKQTPMS